MSVSSPVATNLKAEIDAADLLLLQVNDYKIKADGQEFPPLSQKGREEWIRQVTLSLTSLKQQVINTQTEIDTAQRHTIPALEHELVQATKELDQVKATVAALIERLDKVETSGTE